MSKKSKSSGLASCSIGTFIRETDPELLEMFDDLCLTGAITGRPRTKGLTFLYPAKDTPIRDALVKLFNTNREDAQRALSSLILTNIFSDGEAFKAFADDIPNRLFKSVPLVSSGKQVSIGDAKDPLVIEKNEHFKPFTTKQNIAVWNIVKGATFLDDPNYPPSKGLYNKEPRRERRGGPGVAGAGETASVDLCRERRIIILKMLQEILNAEGSFESMKGSITPRVIASQFIDDLVCHLFYMETADKGDAKVQDMFRKGFTGQDYKESLDRVALVYSDCPIATFFLVFEPFKTVGSQVTGYIIPTPLLREWAVHMHTIGATIDKCSEGAPKLVKARLAIIAPGIKSVAPPKAVTDAQGPEIATLIHSAYQEIAKGTTVFAEGFVKTRFDDKPEQFGNYLQWISEVRSLVSALCGLLRTGNMSILEMYDNVATSYPGDNWEKELQFVTKDLLESGVPHKFPAMRAAMLTNFVKAAPCEIAATTINDEYRKKLAAAIAAKA
jgi:hypothetical protein